MKDDIIRMSLRQFLMHGIRKMTVQRLVRPMGISTKTFYRYFDNKEELLRHCLVTHYSTLAKDFDNLDAGGQNPLLMIFQIWHRAIELDFGVNHVFYHDLNYYYPDIQDSVIHKLFRKNTSVLKRLTARAVEEGYFRSDIAPALIPEVIGLLYSSITRTEQFKKFRLAPQALVENTIDAYLRGLCTEKGLVELQNNRSTIK